MELLTTTLGIILLTTASSVPIGRYHHYDADITDSDWMQGWLEGNNLFFLHSSESSSFENSPSGLTQLLDSSSQSSESSESSQSQSSEESFEDTVTNRPHQTTPVKTTVSMATTTTEDGSTLTPEPNTSTDEVTVRTPPPGTPSTPAVATSPGNGIDCFIDEIPTEGPITDNRGDN